METSSFFIIVFSAMMHAGWNFFTKRSTANKIAVLWLGWIIAGIFTFPIAYFTSDFTNASPDWVIYFIATCVTHACYLYMLGHSYSIGEMSLIYPISRGCGIFITVLVVTILGVDQISSGGLLGVIVLASGIIMIALKSAKDLEKQEAIKAAAKVGICVSMYSVVDKLSVAKIPVAFYMSVMFMLSPVILIPIMFKQLKAQTIVVLQRHKTTSALIGLVSYFTYLLVLYAMKNSPAAYVVALREMSIVFGSLLGIWLLKEEKSARKLAGILIIMIGAILIKIS